MAEILVKFDTKEKILEVTKDGKKIQDVSCISFSSYGEKGSVTIETGNMDEDDVLYTVTHIYADEQGEDVVEETTKDNLTHDLSKILLHNRLRN